MKMELKRPGSAPRGSFVADLVRLGLPRWKL